MSCELKTGYCINILEQPLGNCLRTYLHSSLSQKRMRILTCKEITDVKKHVKLLPLIKHQAKQSSAGPSCWADCGHWRNLEDSCRQDDLLKLNYEECLWDGRQGKGTCHLAWQLKLDSLGPQGGGREPTSTIWPLTSTSSPWCMKI